MQRKDNDDPCGVLLAAAHAALDAALSNLRDAGSAGTATESLAVLPLIKKTATLRIRLAQLIAARKADSRVDASARLNAAVPELLKACKAILAWADKECLPQGGKDGGPWEMVEAAIAKATGEVDERQT